MKVIVSIFGFISCMVAVPLHGQTILENPTACFGRDCNRDALVSISKGERNTSHCFDTNDSQILMDKTRPGCTQAFDTGFGYIHVSFGNVEIPTTARGFTRALYSLEEIQNTVARYGSTVKAFVTWTGAYEACASADSTLNAGLGYVEYLKLTCGEQFSFNIPHVSFNVWSRSGRFDADWNPPGTDDHRGYFDLNLSQCKSDLILYLDTANTCKFDIDLLQIQFQQK